MQRHRECLLMLPPTFIAAGAAGAAHEQQMSVVEQRVNLKDQLMTTTRRNRQVHR
jgi:hypothetical protein